MPLKLNKISLVYFVLITLLLVGLVPLVLTGWFLSERSGKELRAVEGRYQTQLVQDKARQIEMFGQRYGELVGGIAKAFELSQNLRAKWLTADYAEKRRVLEIVFLNFVLDDVTLVPETRKPFDVLAEGLLVQSSRGDRI